MKVSLLTVPWEEQGSAKPQGQRKYVLGERPYPWHENFQEWSKYQDLLAIATALNRWGLGRWIAAPDMITVSDSPTGSPPMMISISGIPAWRFRKTGVAPNTVEEVYISGIIPDVQGMLLLDWSSPATSGQTVVWGYEVYAVPEGGSVDGTGSSMVQAFADSILSYGRNVSRIDFGPLGGDGMLVRIRLWREWEAQADLLNAPVYLHAVWLGVQP